MMKFDNTTQSLILGMAIKLVGYEAVAVSTLKVISAEESIPEKVKDAIRAMAFKFSSLNGGRPEAATILRQIQTVTWAEIGLDRNSIEPLGDPQREAIINIVMFVSKQIVRNYCSKLEAMCLEDTSLPEGWNE